MTTFIVSIVIIAIVVILILAKFFVRTSRAVSLVRTGMGGRKVIMDGGGFAIPWFQELTRVNMQSQKLNIHRGGESSLITKDRMRVDVGAELNVSVTPSEEGIARAAQALGDRTFNAEKLTELVEGRVVDALRGVAATNTLDALHENRNQFTDDVFNKLKDWFSGNGLQLESVSLTALDQTPFAALDENNAFNAEGMRRLAEVVANARKERASIDANADVSVRTSAMEANKRKYELEVAERQAEIDKEQQVETLRAAQIAEVSKRKADSELESARARIDMEKEIRAANLATQLAIEETEFQNQRQIEESRIATEEAVKNAEISQAQNIEIARQQQEIALAEHSRKVSEANAAADQAKANATAAASEVVKVKAVAEAERQKAVAIIQASREAEIEALKSKSNAESERIANSERSQSLVERAEADAAVSNLNAAAMENQMRAEAAGREAIIAAENGRNAETAALKLDLARLEAMPGIVEQMVKPVEKVESIKIHQLSGLTGPGGDSGLEKSPLSQAMESLLGMAVQLPLMRQIGDEIGLYLDNESMKEAARTVSRYKPGENR